jgi:hypothetical protein
MRLHCAAKPVLRGTILMQSEQTFVRSGTRFFVDAPLPVRFLNIQEYAAKGKWFRSAEQRAR